MIRVVCFDVGGVLIRITHHWHLAAKHAGVLLGNAIRPSATLSDAPNFERYQRGEIGDAEYLDSLCRYLGVTEADALNVHNRVMLEPYPNVDVLVNSLNRAGYLTGCLSNTNASHWADMFQSGRFPANEALTLRVASHEIGLEKPDSKIFRRFESIAEASGPEIAFFDDSPSNVEAAAMHGWISRLIDPASPTAPQIESHLAEIGVRLQAD